MAKKSAESKGYRKANAKKPYLSKRDIVLLCVLVAAVAVGAFFLFRYDDGALKVKDGAVVTDGDNWLIVNGSNIRGGARYYKLGEVGELAGYTREAKPTLTNPNVSEYVYTAEDEAADIDTVTVSTSHAGAKALSAYAEETLRAVEGTETTEVRQEEVAGRTAHIFSFTSSPVEKEEAEETNEAPAEETVEATAEATAEDATEDSVEDAAEDKTPAYQRAICAYIDAGHDSCVVLRLQGGGDSIEACPADEALNTALAEAIQAVKLEEGNK